MTLAPDKLPPVAEPNVKLPDIFAVPVILAPVPVIVNVVLPTAAIVTFPFAVPMYTLLLPFANVPTKLLAVIFPTTANTLVVLLNVKLALPFAVPASLNMICVLDPATGPVAPVDPIAPVAPVLPRPVAPVLPIAPVAPVLPRPVAPVLPIAPVAPVAPAPVAPVAPPLLVRPVN